MHIFSLILFYFWLIKFTLFLFVIYFIRSYTLPCIINFNNVLHLIIRKQEQCNKINWVITIILLLAIFLMLLCTLLISKHNNVITFSCYAVVSILKNIIFTLAGPVAHSAHSISITITILVLHYITKCIVYCSCIPRSTKALPSLKINLNHPCYCISTNINYSVRDNCVLFPFFFTIFFYLNTYIHTYPYLIKTTNHESLCGRCLPKLSHNNYIHSTFFSLENHVTYYKISAEYTYDFEGIINVLRPASVGSVIVILLYYIIVITNG